jgi:glucokinase
VNGLPCSGKTTLAREISQKYALPLIEKDKVKEILFDSLGWNDVTWSRRLSHASKQVLFYLISEEINVGHSLIVECNFISEYDSLPLQAAILGKNCQIIQIICHAPGEVLIERFRNRTGTRHPGHNDELLLTEIEGSLKKGTASPLKIEGSLLEVDTSDQFSIQQMWKSLSMIFH